MKPSSLLGHAKEILSLILSSGRPADRELEAFFRSRKYLGSHDRRFIAETAYGTLRHLRRSRQVVQEALGGLASDIPEEDALALAIAAYLSGTKYGKGGVLADDLAPNLRSTKLSPQGILERIEEVERRLAGEENPGPGVTLSFPDWLVDRLLAQFGGEDGVRLLRSLNEPAPITLRVNTLRVSVEECQDVLKRQGIDTIRTPLSPVGLQVSKRFNMFSIPAFREGLFEVQDEGSQLIPLLLDPKPTAKVLDACAGAGGKTLEFSAIMKNRGEIFAGDTSERRLTELRKRARRAGAFNVRVRTIDLTAPPPTDLAGQYDLVFVDAPCSGLGTIRRNPGIKWTATPAMISELSEKQARLLTNSAQAVRPGGKLAYSTCTFLPDENDQVVARLLRDRDDFELLRPAEYVSNMALEVTPDAEYLRLLPHVHGTDGFFLAVLRRNARP